MKRNDGAEEEGLPCGVGFERGKTPAWWSALGKLSRECERDIVLEILVPHIKKG